MKLFDSHCHLDDKVFRKDLDAVIQRAGEAGVEAMLIAGVTRKSADRAVALAETRPGVYASVGVHPHDARECSEPDLAYLHRLAKHPRVRAWGETGLDFNRMFSPRKDQEKWFVRQLEMADDLGLPLIFHERDSGGRFLDILLETHNEKRRGVVHCFSGNRAELTAYLDLGFYIGITGILTIKTRGADLRSLAPLIPAQRLLVETDAPYLTPAPEKNRTRRNEPAFVRSTFLKLAQVRGEDSGDLAKKIWDNTCRLFRIEL